LNGIDNIIGIFIVEMKMFINFLLIRLDIMKKILGSVYV